MKEIAEWLGWGAMVLGGGLLVLAGLLIVYWTAYGVARETHKRLRAVYNWNVLAYWFQRLEKEGVRVFQRAEEDDSAWKARQAAAQPADFHHRCRCCGGPVEGLASQTPNPFPASLRDQPKKQTP